VKKCVGRPPGFSLRLLQKAEKLWRKGEIDEDVAKALKICCKTLYTWFKKYPEFLQAKTSAKAYADSLVEQALFKRATGFVAPDCHVSQWDGSVTITPLEKHYPPETAAIVFWLKNRKPKEWRDKAELHIEQEIAGVPPDVVEMMRAEFKKTVTSDRNSHD